MKKLFIIVAILFSIVATAQTSAGYDGGNELYNAIKKARQNRTSVKSTKSKKSKPVKKKTTTVREIKAPERTPYEAAYYQTYGTDCASYLKKLMASEYWEVQKQSALQVEIESEKRHAEQRKLDSIENDHVKAEQEKLRKADTIKPEYQITPVSPSETTESKQYEKIREEQRKNKPKTIWTVLKKKS